MAMTDAAAEAKRAYKRKWNRENREKVKAAQERYWERIAAQNANKTQDKHEAQEV